MRIRYAGIHWVDWIIARIDCSLQCQHNELLVVQLMYLLQFANELPQFVFYPKMKERFNNSKGKKNPENFNFSKMRGCQFLVQWTLRNVYIVVIIYTLAEARKYCFGVNTKKPDFSHLPLPWRMAGNNEAQTWAPQQFTFLSSSFQWRRHTWRSRNARSISSY